MTKQEYAREYHKKNRERLNAKTKRLYAANKEKYLATQRIYNQKHREEIRAQRKRAYWENKAARSAAARRKYLATREQTIARAAKYSRANPEKARAWKNAYRLRNPELAHAHRHNRRARMKNAEGRLDKRMIQQVYEDNVKRFGQLTCYLCFQPVSFADASIDHRVPIARGGSNLYENLQIAHLTCNLRKNKRTEAEYHLRFSEVFCD